MKQNPLLTTMSTSMFNKSETPSKISKTKYNTNSLSLNRQYDKSRSISMIPNSNFLDSSRSPSVSLIKRQNSLHDRLYNQAKELKEKIEIKKNEFIDNLRRDSIPKIHEISKKIERKAELFPERLYPYHKLNKLDTDPDNSFEYAHVATVMSNPLGMSGEFDKNDYKNNIDNIFCDNEEIKNLYGNKPSFVKIYRGIKHPKKQQFSFKPTLTKNTNKIIEDMKISKSDLPLRRIKSLSQDDLSIRQIATDYKTNNLQIDLKRNSKNSTNTIIYENMNFPNEIRKGNLIDITADNISTNKINNLNNSNLNDNSQIINLNNMNAIYSTIKGLILASFIIGLIFAQKYIRGQQFSDLY